MKQDAFRSDYGNHPLRDGIPPRWASGWGEDAHGPWVSFDLERDNKPPVYQRMRWIPPGRFWMGSPVAEDGRWEEEGPRHEVTISHGFWLFETPCTQALWEAVMGVNPSHFVSETRPVEQVSWEACVVFMDRINERVPGLGLSLPTEAEWEYACRAGTETATYAGPLVIEGANNAPVLDGIAWYGGNSGLDFDLDNGVDSTDWSEKQYPHEKAGSRPVGLKKPNGWGLYDMLGNVLEWCADWYGDYPDEAEIDPVGPVEGESRVIRGGSWVVSARGVRSACRGNFSPDYRSHLLGFRCARVQAGAEPRRTVAPRPGGAAEESPSGG